MNNTTETYLEHEPLSSSDKVNSIAIKWLGSCALLAVWAVVGGITITALDTEDERLEFQMQQARLEMFERLVHNYDINPMVIDCIINPVQNVNNARFVLCNNLGGAITKAQISELVSNLPDDLELGN